MACLSWDEQSNLTITYATMLGGEFTSNENPVTYWYRRWWRCNGYEGGTQYLAACRYLESLDYYVHTNGTLMKLKRLG